MAAWLSKDLPNPDGVINRDISVSTKIYDRKGEVVLYDIHGDIKRTLIDLESIPVHVINATLTAEDRDFYSHKGISITGILRSIFLNVTTSSKNSNLFPYLNS
jgi:membrane carboxypeptidase/penicillin-binding protein